MPCLMPLGSSNRARRLRGLRRQEPTYLFKDEIPVLVGVEALQVVVQCVANLLQGQHTRCRSEASDVLPDQKLQICMPVQHGRSRAGLYSTKKRGLEASGMQRFSTQPQAPLHSDVHKLGQCC